VIPDLSPLVTTPLLAFAATIILYGAALFLFPRWGLLDFPERYGLTRKRLPYPAGIVGVVVFLLLFPFLHALQSQMMGLMAAVVMLSVTAFVDDRYPLPASLRLCVQCGAAALIFWTGDCTGGRICSITNPFEQWTHTPFLELNSGIPIVAFIVTVFWILLTTNALNWLDGIPGQVEVLSLIGFLTIGFLSLSERVDQPELALLAFVLAGISGAGMLFSLPIQRVVLGDTGAMFYGFLLGTLTIVSGGKVATAFLVLGVPLLDVLFVVVRRLRHGRSPFRGSASGEHLHHRLLAKGWSPLAVIALTATVGTTFGIGALFLDTFQKLIAAAILFGCMLLLSLYSTPDRRKREYLD